jgi:hypothetical protein
MSFNPEKTEILFFSNTGNNLVEGFRKIAKDEAAKFFFF